MEDKYRKDSNDFLEIGTIVNLPGRKPVGFFVEFKLEALLKVGILKNILTIFEKYNCPIVNLHASTPSIEKPITAYIVADMYEREDKIDLIRNEIKKISMVNNVKVIYPLHDGLLASLPTNKLSMAGSRCIIYRKPVYEAFIKSVQAVFGIGGSAILYHLGIVLGKESFKDHKRLAKDDNELLISIVENFFRSVGYGILEVRSVDLNKGRVTVRVYDNFECELYKKSDKPSSQYVRGILLGWFQEFLDKKDIKILETKCIAKGDPYCEYEIL